MARKANEKFKGRSQEMKIIKRSMRLFLRKYGYEILNYVAMRVLGEERKRRNLKEEITQKEIELAELKSKSI